MEQSFVFLFCLSCFPYDMHVFIFSFPDELMCFCFFRSLGIQYSDHFYRYFSYLSYLIGYQLAELDVSSNVTALFQIITKRTFNLTGCCTVWPSYQDIRPSHVK